MQETFKKIIEKLEEIQIENTCSDCPHKEKCDEVQENISDEKTDLCGATIKALAIEIVKQTAEEYNNGWIPCSERLPEEGGYYLVTYHEWSNGDYLPKFDDTYVRRLHYQKSERFTGWNHPRYCDDKAENDTNREVIAWQKLPQPYQPKGE